PDRFRQGPDALYQLEQCGSLELAYDVTERRAEEVDVGAQAAEAVVVNRRSDVPVTRHGGSAHGADVTSCSPPCSSAQMRVMLVARVPSMSMATAQTVALPVAGR